MNTKNEAKYQKEFDRLLTFVFAFQETFFTKGFLEKMGFVSKISLGNLLQWAKEQKMIVDESQMVVFWEESKKEPRKCVGWRIASGAVKHFEDLPSVRSAAVEDVVRIGSNPDTGKLIESSSLEGLAKLRRFQNIARPMLLWLKEQRCILYNPTASKLEPGSHGLGFSSEKDVWSLFMDLSVITPVFRCSKTFDIIWKVNFKRVLELIEALRRPCFMPKGIGLEVVSRADVLYQAYYGSDLIHGSEDAVINRAIGGYEYRWFLRFLRNKQDGMLDYSRKSLKECGIMFCEGIIPDLKEVGILIITKNKEVLAIQRDFLDRILDVVYNPSSIPEFLSGRSGQINFLGAGGPSEDHDVYLDGLSRNQRGEFMVLENDDLQERKERNSPISIAFWGRVRRMYDLFPGKELAEKVIEGDGIEQYMKAFGAKNKDVAIVGMRRNLELKGVIAREREGRKCVRIRFLITPPETTLAGGAIVPPRKPAPPTVSGGKKPVEEPMSKRSSVYVVISRRDVALAMALYSHLKGQALDLTQPGYEASTILGEGIPRIHTAMVDAQVMRADGSWIRDPHDVQEALLGSGPRENVVARACVAYHRILQASGGVTINMMAEINPDHFGFASESTARTFIGILLRRVILEEVNDGRVAQFSVPPYGKVDSGEEPDGKVKLDINNIPLLDANPKGIELAGPLDVDGVEDLPGMAEEEVAPGEEPVVEPLAPEPGQLAVVDVADAQLLCTEQPVVVTGESSLALAVSVAGTKEKWPSAVHFIPDEELPEYMDHLRQRLEVVEEEARNLRSRLVESEDRCLRLLKSEELAHQIMGILSGAEDVVREMAMARLKVLLVEPKLQ